MRLIKRETEFTPVRYGFWPGGLRRRDAKVLLNSAKFTFQYFKAQLFVSISILLLMSAPVYAVPHIKPDQWQQLTQDKAFSYKNDIEAIQPVKQYNPGAIQKIIAAIFNFFGSGAGNVLLWIIVIGAVTYISYKLFLSSDSFLFSRGEKILREENKELSEEDLETTNWEALLQQAISNSDMRLAVRYSYKWLLQLLQQRELIQYRNDKTNYEYYTELNETKYKQPFKQLSRQYEYAWYGRFALSPAAYNDYLALFHDVRKQLGA